jgi:hypothetical protein
MPLAKVERDEYGIRLDGKFGFKTYLSLFRHHTKTLTQDDHRDERDFDNLQEFKDYWSQSAWQRRRQDSDYVEHRRCQVYVARHPDAESIPPRVSEDIQPKRYASHSFSKKITVKSKDDPKEYNRQYKFFKKYPDETECPSKDESRLQYSVAFQSRRDTDKRVTVRKTDDRKEYCAQRYWLSKNPDHIGDCPPKKERDKTKGKYKYPKITVKASDDRTEWTRQARWFNKHPESDKCPPR